MAIFTIGFVSTSAALRLHRARMLLDALDLELLLRRGHLLPPLNGQCARRSRLEFGGAAVITESISASLRTFQDQFNANSEVGSCCQCKVGARAPAWSTLSIGHWHCVCCGPGDNVSDDLIDAFEAEDVWEEGAGAQPYVLSHTFLLDDSMADELAAEWIDGVGRKGAARLAHQREEWAAKRFFTMSPRALPGSTSPFTAPSVSVQANNPG